MKENQFFNQSVEDLLDLFGVSARNGLSDAEVKKRLLENGHNRLETKKQKSLLRMFLEQFKSSMVIILLIAAIVSGVIGLVEGEGLMETFVILGILVINAVIGTVQEKKAQASLNALNKMSSPRTKVLREGQVFQTDSTGIVPGDIVILDTGDIVPADIRLMEAVNLKIQESSLTGESVPVEKINTVLEGTDIPLGDRDNMAFSTGVVTYGRGKGIVTATGM
ncbi:MAG: HAD-IC family P-type ATPase, partial [Bacteroidales bacterium]